MGSPHFGSPLRGELGRAETEDATLKLKRAGANRVISPYQIGGVQIAQTARDILYCDGTDVVRAETVGFASPIPVSDGGTGATTASGARTNLDVPSTLDAFTYTQMFG